ncbi:MAG: acetyl-CoA carboxylase biotin carboxylase subunit [Proteobacteria bacterium]|nr:acetyl-CoA carboxylase biotin carboxylase subunit [Pseudomonadota bacterium]
MPLFQKILIANRGEIAVRIIRACRELGIQTVAVHSTADASSMHVKLADESVCIGPAASKDSYLKISSIMAAAEITGADAIHPGFGFLSENAKFAHIVEEHNLAFIGPSSDHIQSMGDKITAKKTMIDLGVPVIPGSKDIISSIDEAYFQAEKIGYPVLIKASNGGGGKGMKVAFSKGELFHSLSLAKAEAKANFGSDDVYMERYLKKPRHIEFQILADTYGNCVHLGERDCSIQRRHQKIWEEALSPVITSKMREKMGKTITRAMSKMGYKGVGTLEFLYEDGEFFFMEMNTRIQVEHTISEMITGIDLIKEQIKVAAGQKLSFSQEDIVFKGHAIECRINAEDPNTFIPSPGKIDLYHVPGGPGIRVDSHMYQGFTISPHYDSMVAKLIAYGNTREEAIARMKRALREYVITGIQTSIPLHLKLVDHPDIVSGDYTIHWLENHFLRD